MPSNHLILCHPLLLLPSVFPSSGSIPVSGLFTLGSQSIRIQLQHQSFQWLFRLIFPRVDWFDLPVVQGTLQSLLQHHSSKASVLWCSASFMVQLSHPYMTTGKTIALTIQSFVGKVISLLFNMLSRFVIAFLPRSKCLLISWLQLPSAVILEPKKIKSVTVSTFAPSICLEVMGLDAMILVFWMLNFKPAFSFSFVQPGISHDVLYIWASLIVQSVRNLPAVQETWVQLLGWEDPLEKEMATHFSILAWKSHGHRSLVGCSPRGHKESGTTEWLTFMIYIFNLSKF